MRNSRRIRHSLLLSLGLLAASTTVARAGGPLLIFDAGTRTPYAYASPVNMYTDLGTLGGVTNARANTLVTNSAAAWTGVATSSFTATVAGNVSLIGLGDITAANVGGVIGVDNTGNGITVIYDSNGTIMTNFFGVPPGVLGIAQPEFASGSTITESWIALNGASIDPGDLPLANSWAGVITHEMGHSINLAHTQTNGAIIFFGDDRGPDSCALPYPSSLSLAATETMYPFIDPSPGSTGVQQATVEHLDDTSSISDIYPAAGYPGNFGTIEGRIFRPDGVTEITGVNVIARNVANPFLNAQSALSGDFTQGALGPDGFYRLTGLTPGANYVLYVDTIVQGGFSTTPVGVLPGPEEFWNTGETNNSVLDPPCDVNSVNVAAGQTITLDVELNAAGLPPVIDVSPLAISESVAPNSITNVPLTISNVAGVGGLDLDWSLVDAQLAIGAPVFDTDLLVSERIGVARTAAPVVRDSRDPVLARQCTDCGAMHERKVTPIELGALPKAVGVINDGSFELGPFGGAWAEASSNFGTPVCDAGTCGTGGMLGARTGSFWVWFGGFSAGNETGSMSQSVEFPNGGQIALEFWFDQGGCDSASDIMEVRIDGNLVYSVNGAAANCADGVGYALRSIDVSAYADGGFHTVQFSSQTVAANGGVTNFFVDDVALVESLADCTWLSATPSGGSILTGGSTPVSVQLDATGLAPGVYDCELRIASNDPATPLVIVPVQIEVVDESVIVVDVTTGLNGPASLYATPGGNGDSFSAAQGWSGVVGDPGFVVDATITVQLSDSVTGDPIVGFPAENIGVQAQFGGWEQCAGSLLFADGPTDAGGFTTISGVLYAGGSSAPGELLQVTVDSPDLGAINYEGGGDGLEIFVNSADLNRDFVVNLADVGAFSGFFVGAYGYPADFSWNGLVALPDLGRFAVGLATACPAPPLAANEAPAAPTDVVGVYFDPIGSSASRALVPGELADAFVLLRGSAASAGVLAWDLKLRTSDNLVIESRTTVGSVLDLGEGSSHIVGLGTTRRADGDGVLQLLHLRVRVTDGQPAHLWLEPSDRSTLDLPSVASEGEVHRALPSSGDVLLPVAGINDANFAVGDVNAPRRELAMTAVPNPFNPATEIRFAVPVSGNVELRILDARGQLVQVLRNEVMQAGEHVVTWNGTDRSGRVVGSGVYFASLQSAAGGLSQKLLLIK